MLIKLIKCYFFYDQLILIWKNVYCKSSYYSHLVGIKKLEESITIQYLFTALKLTKEEWLPLLMNTVSEYFLGYIFVPIRSKLSVKC